MIVFLKRFNHINWVLADQTMVSGVNFGTGLILARFLGLEEFGSFTLLWMLVLFINSIQFSMICGMAPSVALCVRNKVSMVCTCIIVPGLPDFPFGSSFGSMA